MAPGKSLLNALKIPPPETVEFVFEDPEVIFTEVVMAPLVEAVGAEVILGLDVAEVPERGLYV